MKCYIAPFCGGQGTFSAWLPAHSPHGRPLVKPLCLNLRSENWQSKLGAFVSSAKPKIENDFPTPVWGSRERGHQLFPACPLLVCGGCFYWAQVSAWVAAEPLSQSHVIDGEKGQSKQSPKVLRHFFIFQGFFFSLLFWFLCWSCELIPFRVIEYKISGVSFLWCALHSVTLFYKYL